MGRNFGFGLEQTIIGMGRVIYNINKFISQRRKNRYEGLDFRLRTHKASEEACNKLIFSFHQIKFGIEKSSRVFLVIKNLVFIRSNSLSKNLLESSW